jgi:hypothetical protein
VAYNPGLPLFQFNKAQTPDADECHSAELGSGRSKSIKHGIPRNLTIIRRERYRLLPDQSPIPSQFNEEPSIFGPSMEVDGISEYPIGHRTGRTLTLGGIRRLMDPQVHRPVNPRLEGTIRLHMAHLRADPPKDWRLDADGMPKDEWSFYS